MKKWRRVNENENSKKNIRLLKGKILKGNVERIKGRYKRELLIKKFFINGDLRKPEYEYYLKM